MPTEINETTRCFILDAFANMDELRIFLLLSADRERAFALSSISANLNQSNDKARAGAAHLLENGLIVEVTEPVMGFKYGPASPGLAALAEEVIRIDREMPVTLLRLVASRPAEPVKAFADAFKLR